jgi:trehalose-6-phosphatase
VGALRREVVIGIAWRATTTPGLSGPLLRFILEGGRMRRFHALAVDFDGTIAHEGVVAPATIDALARVHASGRRLLLVTGRQLEDLRRCLPRLELFDRIVAEDGAVLVRPAAQ